MSSIFGGDTGITYEQLQQRKKLVDSYRQPTQPRNVGEGIHAIARALVARGVDKQNTAAETKLKGEADAVWQSLLGGGSSMSASPGAALPSPVRTGTEADAIGGDTMETLIRTGMQERGFPEHVTDGFIMNFRDESNLNPAINEIEPLVPGSRGGFGLAQWTGPRRVALEEFAQSRGKPPSDLGTQLDFLKMELEGPEARAGRTIMSAKNAPEAATAIVTDFLRPAPEHRDRRVAQYGGGSSGQPSGGQPNVQAIVQALGNPMIQNDPGKMMVLQALLGQAMERPDPMDALELERAQLEIEQMRNPQPDLTGTQREYDMAVQQGFQGSFLDYKTALAEAGRAQTNVTTNVGGSEVGTIPPGYELFTDEAGARSMRPIPGGPVAREAELGEEKELGRTAQTARAGGTVIQDLQRARNLIPELGALSRGEGVIGGISRTQSAKVPGTVANRITQFTESALSNVGLDTLQQMRENSPTGGALGQVPIQQQQRLEQVLGSLNINQPPPELDANLRRVMNIYTDIIHGDANERARAVAEGRMTPEQNAEIEGYYFELPFDARGNPVQGESGTFEQFAADPTAQAAAKQYGVTIEEMWEIKKGLQ